MKKLLSWSFIGNIIYALSQMVILVVLSHGNDFEVIGYYGLALAFTGPLIKIINMQFNMILASDSERRINFTSLLFIRFSLLILVLVIISILIVSLYNTSLITSIILLVAFSKTVESIIELGYGYFQREEAIELIAKSKIKRGVGSIVLFGGSYYLTADFILSMTLLIVSWIVILIYDFRKIDLIPNDLLKKTYHYKDFIFMSFPLGISGTIDLINVNIPRYYGQVFLSDIEIGYYTIVSYFMVVGGILIDSMCLLFIPKLSKLYSGNEIAKFNKSVWSINMFAISLGILGLALSYIIGPLVLDVVFNIENPIVAKLLSIIMIGCAFWYFASFYNAYLFAMKIYKNQLKIMIICLMITLTSGYYLIENFGLSGAGWTFVVYMGTRFLLTYITYWNVAKKLLKRS
ncbi:lipopolysaccharide biosynthesis protein [Exiguobacterium chiriqhucha]|uniref:lipopolysaccharide biosynthesis protein n=1 Tax=Exiguobacterium chiriqhucha TaxID=1385984 RepID=UPI0004950C01|nr:oligosaccharide flippase family protein [Exiguobacterium chiriqhucha]